MCYCWFSLAQSLAQLKRFLLPIRDAVRIRHLDLRYSFSPYKTKTEWTNRAATLRRQILVSAGLWPLEKRQPVRANISGRIDRGAYTIEKVYFESLPGFYVTGNLYRPKNPQGKVPAILSPHGHWSYGRFENTPVASIPARAAGLARMGMVVFTYDMVGYGDNTRVSHRFAEGHREGFDANTLWSVNLLGLQLWNSIRALDFVQSLPEVDSERIGCTGESGGGTQTFLLAAVDERVKVAAPVNMILSTYAGWQPLRKRAKFAHRHEQYGTRCSHRAQADAHGVGHRRLDRKHVDRRVSGN